MRQDTLTPLQICSKADPNLIPDDAPSPLEILMAMEEPEHYEDYPDTFRKYIRILSLVLMYIKSSRSSATAVYGVIYALGLEHLTEGKSMNQLSMELGGNHSLIHYHKTRFEELLKEYDINLNL